MAQREGDARPPLTRVTSVRDFRDFYWLKRELESFCRAHGIPASGSKRAIADRIEQFLRSGRRDPVAPSKDRARSNGEGRAVPSRWNEAPSLQTRAPVGFRCTQEARCFFEQHLGPRFRFTVTLQSFIKEHPGVTFGEIAEEWRRQDELRRRGELRPEIAPQFEFNRFTRDFFADPCNAGKTREDCLHAWRRTRARRGDRRYRAESTFLAAAADEPQQEDTQQGAHRKKAGRRTIGGDRVRSAPMSPARRSKRA